MNTTNDTKPTPRIPKFYDVADMLNKPSPEELGLLPMVSEDRAWWPPGENRTKPNLDLARKHAATLDPSVHLTLDFTNAYFYRGILRASRAASISRRLKGESSNPANTLARATHFPSTIRA